MDRNIMLQVSQRTECFYARNLGLLSCHGPNSTVECKTELSLDNGIEFELYAIAKCEKCTENMLRIIPRKLDNSAWISESSVYLYLNGEKKFNGLRITDVDCYAKLDRLFKESLRNEKVLLESDDEEIAYIIGKNLSDV